MKYQIIQDPEDERVKDYYLLKSKEPKSDLFIADHEKTAVRLLNSDLEVESVFCTEKYYDKHKSIIEFKVRDPNKRFVAETSVFENTIGFSVHQGFMSIGKQLWSPVSKLSFPAIAINGIVDSENIGSIFRTAAAFGIESILVDERSSNPYLRRSVRVSMGAILKTKIFRVENLKNFLNSNSTQKVRTKIISLSLPKENSALVGKTKSVYEIPKENDLLLVVGNENDGIQDEILEVSDLLAYIPMKNSIDSLNVSHALAVALSHLLKD
ncbi:MAG: RNA methyltransferase [Leptospira sp.]|nr:RNA methyltransferase [Leptospira sp.]